MIYLLVRHKLLYKPLGSIIDFSTLLNSGNKSIYFSTILLKTKDGTHDCRCLQRCFSSACSIKTSLRRFRSTAHFSENEIPTPNILQTGAQQVPDKSKVISKAMKAYLERAREHDEFIKKATAEFEIGRRHLANMMGMDADTMTQEDIDRAIEYLFPSFLYEKKARPMMKHPTEINPKRKAAEFDETGRPFHFLFYTKKPNYYSMLYDAVEKMEELDAFEDRMLAKGIKEIPPESVLDLKGSKWIDKATLESKILETLKDEDYEYFIQTLTRLLEHQYSFRVKDFIMQYRQQLMEAATLQEIPPLMFNERGHPYMSSKGVRKTAEAFVTVIGNGTGLVNINGKDIAYFASIQDREQILFPLQFCELLGKVDLDATVSGGGHSSQAGAVRHAISLAVRSFLSPDIVEKMRIAGLLTRDRRKCERKKPGQKGARAKFTWKKR